MRVLLHPDGGTDIGLGHASRCSSLASALIRLGHEVRLLVDSESGLADYLSRFKLPVIEGLTNTIDIQAEADKFSSDVIVVDNYRWAEADFSAIRCHDRLVVAFDDTARRFLPVDGVINGSPFGLHMTYRTLPETRLWLGLTYQVIREEFRGCPMRKLSGTVSRLIVLLGGDDPLSLMPQLASRVDAIAREFQPPLQVEIICGPYSPMPNTDKLNFVKVTRHPVNLRERMLAADLALSASGQTLYELASCGTPTIAFCTGEDQAANLAALSEEGVTWDAGQASNPNWIVTVEEAIRTLAANKERREYMSVKAQSLIDGCGADRIVAELEQLVANLVTSQERKIS